MSVRKAWGRRKNIILVDARIDVACAVLWLIYGAWGLWVPVVNANALLAVAPDFYPVLWGGVIGLAGMIAGICALANLATDPNRLGLRIWTHRWERFAVATLVGFILVLPTIQIGQMFTAGGDRFDVLILSFSYVVIPIWRLFHLGDRVKDLRRIKGA